MSDFIINPNTVVYLPSYKLNEREFEKIRLGQFIFENTMNDGVIKLIFEDNLIAIGVKSEGKIKPKTVIL